jgi:hypothetical protein
MFTGSTPGSHLWPGDRDIEPTVSLFAFDVAMLSGILRGRMSLFSPACEIPKGFNVSTLAMFTISSTSEKYSEGWPSSIILRRTIQVTNPGLASGFNLGGW